MIKIKGKLFGYKFDYKLKQHYFYELTIPTHCGDEWTFSSSFSKQEAIDEIKKQETMGDLKTGDILHCTSNSLLSKIIRFATSSNWSHTAIAIEVWGEMCVIEAQSNGVNIKTYDNWQKKYGYRYKVHRNRFMSNPQAFSKRAMSKSGVTGYDFVSLILRAPQKIITGSWRKTKKSEDRMFCSEYAAWCHGIKGAYQMSPDDLHREILYDGNWEVIYESK